MEVYEEFHEFHRSVKTNFHANRRKRVFNYKLDNKCKYKQMGKPPHKGGGGRRTRQRLRCNNQIITVLKRSPPLSVYGSVYKLTEGKEGRCVRACMFPCVRVDP